MNTHTDSIKPRIVVIGVGHLGAIHVKLWTQNAQAVLVGVLDENAERAQAVLSEVGNLDSRVFTSLAEALENADAVSIVTPTSTHFDIATLALSAGKHCFIEKPITTTSLQALELNTLAEQNGCVIHVGHVERFNPALRAFQSSTQHYDFAPLFIEAHRLAQFKPRATDVSVILDLMIHDIDIVLWLVKSRVVQIDANGVAVLTDTPDIANARIRFENGCVANLTASRITQKPMRKMRVFQRDAYVSMDFAEKSVEVFRLMDEEGAGNAMQSSLAGGVPAMMLGNIEAGTRNRAILFEKPIVTDSNAIAAEQQHFLDAIRLGDASATPPATTALEAAEALRVAEIITAQMMG